jgi:hypothetical protein
MSDNTAFFSVNFDYSYYALEPFSGYVVQAKQPGPGFYSFVAAYAVLAFVLIAPLVSWSRTKEEKKILELGVKHQNHAQHQPPSPPQDETPRGTDPGKEIDRSSPNSRNISSCSRSLSGQGMKSGRVMSSPKSQLSHDLPSSPQSLPATKDPSIQQKQTQQPSSSKRPSSVTSGRSSALRSIVLRELDQSYPDLDPDFQARISDAGTGRRGQPQPRQHQPNLHPQRTSQLGNGSAGSKAPTETSSGAPSAATTTRIYAASSTTNHRFRKLVLDVGGRRWKNRRPIGRVDVIQNAVTHEMIVATNSSVVGGSTTRRGIVREGSIASGQQQSGPAKGGPHTIYSPHHHNKGMSDVASSILSEQHHELHKQPQMQVDLTALKKQQMQQFLLQQQLLHQQQQHPMLIHRLAVMQRQRYQRSQRSYSSRGRSRSVASEQSMMSSIVDDLSPQDAADANDPGRGNIFLDPDAKYSMKYERYGRYQGGFGVHAGRLSGPIEALLSLAAPDDEKLRVLQTSIPLALGASSEALLRLVTAAFISQYLGTDSMTAFLLVGLFVRLTSEELSGAIVDALSAFVQASIHSPVGDSDAIPNTFLAGQYVQLAVILQLLLNIPLLVLWALFMGDIIMWLVDSSVISSIAQDYAFVVVFAYMVQALSRTLTVVFHICGHEHFESVIDMIASMLQLTTIAFAVALVDNISLTTVGYIQLLIIVAGAVAKIAFPVWRGWMQPFRRGLIQNLALVQNKHGIWHLLRATGPLLLGTILEYGEWEILTIFVQHLGSAEGNAKMSPSLPRSYPPGTGVVFCTAFQLTH